MADGFRGAPCGAAHVVARSMSRVAPRSAAQREMCIKLFENERTRDGFWLNGSQIKKLRSGRVRGGRTSEAGKPGRRAEDTAVRFAPSLRTGVGRRRLITPRAGRRASG